MRCVIFFGGDRHPLSCQSVFLFCQDKQGGCQWPIDGQIMKGVTQTKDERIKGIRTKDKDKRVALIKERKVKVSVAANGLLIVNLFLSHKMSS